MFYINFCRGGVPTPVVVHSSVFREGDPSPTKLFLKCLINLCTIGRWLAAAEKACENE